MLVLQITWVSSPVFEKLAVAVVLSKSPAPSKSSAANWNTISVIVPAFKLIFGIGSTEIIVGGLFPVWLTSKKGVEGFLVK